MTNQPKEPFYLTEPYREARRKAEIDINNWEDQSLYRPTNQSIRKRNRDVLGILCFGLSVAIVLLWIGMYYGTRSRTGTPVPQEITTYNSRNGL